MAKTVGFAIGDQDEARLQRLADRFSRGNRSAFLREAMDVMERFDRVRTLSALQAYGERRLVAVEIEPGDLPTVVDWVIEVGDAEVAEQARDLVDSLRGTSTEHASGVAQPLRGLPGHRRRTRRVGAVAQR